MNLPIPPLPASTLNSNITFGELQNYTFEELSNWVDELRNELLKVWDDGLQPHIGMDKQTIINRFNKLKDYDLSTIYTQDELYPDYFGFLKNFSKMGNGVNQFFPGLLKSRVNGISIHDYLSNENLWLEFKYTIVQKVRFDKMFLYSNYLENKNGVSDTDYFLKWNENKILDLNNGKKYKAPRSWFENVVIGNNKQ